MATKDKPTAPDWQAITDDLARVGADIKKAIGEAAAPLRDRAEVEFAKAVAKHPDLYRELKKTVRQLERTADEAARAFGLKADRPGGAGGRNGRA